jgi:hypothetical protein
VSLGAELDRIAGAAASYAADGEQLAGVLAAEPARGERTYVCAFADEAGERTWVALDADAGPVRNRVRVRDAASIAALCEVAADTAGGGFLGELRSRLVEIRLTNRPDGIDEAEEAALALERAVGAPPRLATLDYLDEIGTASRRLEQALGESTSSPFAEAMKQSRAAVDELTAEIERRYKLELT